MVSDTYEVKNLAAGGGQVLTAFAQLTTKRVVAKLFKVTLRTDGTDVVGYNTIDAVKVYGMDAAGKPLTEYSPSCTSLVQEDCFYECKDQHDYIDEDKSVANANVVRAALAWVEKALKVRHVDQKNEVDLSTGTATTSGISSSSQMCKNLPIEKAVDGMLAHEADVVVILTQRPSFTNAIESMTCTRFTSTKALHRPAVIHLNMVPSYSSSAGISSSSLLNSDDATSSSANTLSLTLPLPHHSGVVDSVVHYLYRALGFGREFRTNFVGYNGVNVTTVKEQSGTSWSGRYQVLLNLPKMVSRAESHFGASQLEGVELSTDDSMPLDCKGVCLASRVYNGEVMTAPPYAQMASFDASTHAWSFVTLGLVGMKKSIISLAYFEETGWFLPNYLVAETLQWGKDAGNDFAKQNCKSWGMAGHETSRYLCRLSFEPVLYSKASLEGVAYPTQQEKQCSFDRLHKGMCVTKLWGNELPGHSEYWAQESGMAGLSKQLDYCPVVVPDPSLSYFNADFLVNCRDPLSKNDPQTKFFEEFSESSRCFEANTLGDSKVFTSCLVHKCTKDGRLHIKVRDEVQTCPVTGGKISFLQSGIAVDCTGYQHLCGMYKDVTKPSLSVTSPLDNVVLTTRGLNAVLLIDNYQTGHYLKIFVNDMLYDTINKFTLSENPDEALLTTISLGTLPVSVRSSQSSVKLLYQLVELVDGSEVVLSEVLHNHVVKNTMEQWAKPVNASSEHPAFQLMQGLAQAEDTKGWSPKQVDDNNHHSVVVELESEIQLNSVSVYYNFGYANQQLKSISVANLDAADKFVMVWKSNETIQEIQTSSSTVDTVSFDSAPFFSKLLKLEFDGSQWLEVDAIKCIGYLTILPTLHAQAAATIKLPGDGKQDQNNDRLFSFELPFTSTHTRGSATVFWDSKLDSLDWISVLQGKGIASSNTPASATVAHSLTLSVDLIKAPAGESEVNVRIVDAYETDQSASITKIILKLENELDIEDDPACYDGVLVTEKLAGQCKCAPGAYGSGCELHACPSNCSNNGVCDSFTGTCKCANGYYGFDCSGMFPKCYVSKDGTCESDFTRGTYVIDSGSPDSVNYAEGNAPHSLLCDGKTKPYNEFECSTLSKVEFCCQNKALPACPFFEGSAPCSISNCPYIAAVGLGLQTKIDTGNGTTVSECAKAVLQHCYDTPSDPGCFALEKSEVPKEECPVDVVADHCKEDVNTTECRDLFPQLGSFPKCNFKATTSLLNPCNFPKCRENPFDLGECRGYIETHCAENPEDRECELHGLGDGCFFFPGSAPCMNVDCLQYGFTTDTCRSEIHSYCTYGSSEDPECLVYGYSNAVLTNLMASFTCPWDQIRASCNATSNPGDICRILLRDKLIIPASLPPLVLSSTNVVEKVLQLHAAAVKGHRNANAPAGLVSMLLHKITRSQSGVLNDKELTALLSLFPLEAVLGQYFVNYSWTTQLSDALHPILYSSGFATDYDVYAAVDTHMFGAAVDATAKYIDTSK